MDKARQDETNLAEWENPDNWGGPDWIAVYFSKKDSRTWVPQKRHPTLGWTLNLARNFGIPNHAKTHHQPSPQPYRQINLHPRADITDLYLYLGIF